jgi:hypothetical protein
LEFDLQILNEHLDRVLVIVGEGHDDVCVFHCWLDEVIVCWLYETIVLNQHVMDIATALCNVTLN